MDGPEAFWELLESGVDAVIEVPPERWDVDAYYDPDWEAPGKMVTRKGGFLRGIELLDPAFHEMTLGVDKDGMMLFLDHQVLLDGGAYSSFGMVRDGTDIQGPLPRLVLLQTTRLALARVEM